MKNFQITIAFLFLSCMNIMSQDMAETFIKEAQDFLAKKEYKQAQLSLQDAINDINTLIAEMIADTLPDEINGLVSTNQEISSGAMGMLGGMQITNSYSHPAQAWNEAEVTIMANSPLLSSLSMYMSNPGMMGPGYKSVRVGTRRAILNSQMEDYYDDNGESKQIRVSEIQIPMNQTLITINARGFASEQEELAFAAGLEIDKWEELLGD